MSNAAPTESDLLAQLEGPRLESLKVEIQQQIKLVRGVFVELSRLLKAINLYGADHQSVRQFRSRFFQVLTNALEEKGRFQLDVQSYEFSISEQSIYEDPNPEKNFIYRFYRDGIRALTFHPGISNGEVEQFLDILLTDWSASELFEDDAVTVFSRAAFEHIQLETAKGFGAGESDTESELFSLDELLDLFGGRSREATAFGHYNVAAEKSTVEGLSLDEMKQLLEAPRERERFEKFVELSFLSQAKRESGAQRKRLIELFGTLGFHFLSVGDSGSFERILRQMLCAPEAEFGELLRAMRERLGTFSSVERLFDCLVDEGSSTQASALAALELLGLEAGRHRQRCNTEGRLRTQVSRDANFLYISY